MYFLKKKSVDWIGDLEAEIARVAGVNWGINDEWGGGVNGESGVECSIGALNGVHLGAPSK